jgi:hypothetical protein
MRAIRFLLLFSCPVVSLLSAAPTVQEQALYDAACVAAVDAVNVYRASNGKVALSPLVELCQAAREDAEYRHLGVGDPSKNILDRANDAGYGGTVLNGTSAFDSKGQVSADLLFQRLLSSAGNTAAFLSDDAAYIGVGLAFLAEGIPSEYRLRIILGKAVPGGPQDGTTGRESATGRGLLDLALLREIRAGAWSGDSIVGFVRDPNLVVLTVAEEKAFNEALGTFLRKNSAIRTSVGKGLNLRFPPQVTKFVESFIVKGRIPPGIRFDERTKSFRGAARGSGSFTVTIAGDLKGPVKGSEKLQPIRIRFTIGK